MGSAYDETVFDFDLNFLNPTTTTTTTANTVQELQAKNEKLRRSVIFLKKKILFSNSAVTRYKNARSYANVLENNQVFNKEGCKQHLIEIRNFIEKVTKLENDNQAAENREREKDETISELQNKICALQSLETQLKLLLKEKNKTESTVKVEKKIIVRDSGKNSSLEKENEILRKENAKIPKLEKEIENLRKGQTGVATSEKNCDSLLKDRTTIINLEKEIETLRQENSRISRLQKQIEILSKENVKLSKLEKELQILRKEDTKMTRLEKENESLRKDNARVVALEKEIETLRIKNAKIGFLERVNKTLREENARIQNNNKEGLLTTSIEEKEKSKKSNSGKTSSLSNRNSDWSDHSGAENDIIEDTPMSPQPSDVNAAKNPLPADKNIVRRESENDNSNEVVSVDTGRGSSLAYSDNEKGFHSPGYFSNDSPLNGESIDNKANNNNTPQRIVQIIVQDENDDVSNSEKTATRPGERNTEPPNQISMVKGTPNQTCVFQEESIHLQNSNNLTPKKHTQGVLEKEGLDLHNSMQHEARIDAEVENIFSTMKLNYHAVSPIPRTPIRVRGNDSTKKSSEPSEQIMRCMYLSNKTDHLLTKLKGYLHKCTAEYFCKFNPNLTHQNSKFLNRKVKGGKDFSAVHNIDKLILCFEAILKTKQILTEDCNKSYLDVSDRVCDDDNLLTRSVTGLGSDSFHNKQGEARSIRKTISPPICSPLPVLRDVQRKQLVQNNNTLVSAHATLPEINKDVLQDNQKKARLASINSPMSPESNHNHNDAMQEDQSDTQLLPPVIIVSTEPVQNHEDSLHSNQGRTTVFSNDVSMSPDPMKGCQDALQDNQKETRLSFDIIPVSPAALEKPNSVKQGNQRRTRLFSNDSPMSSDTVQKRQDALQDNQKAVRLSSDNIPGSPEPVKKQNNLREGNQRRTRLFSSDSPMSPDTMQNNRDALQDNQREVRLSSDYIPVSPESVQKQNNVRQGNQRRTRLFSNDSLTSPDPVQKSQDALQDNQKAVRLSSDTTPVSPESVHKQNKEKKSNQRRARLFSNDSSMSPDTMQKNQDALQDKQKEVRLSTETTPVSPASVQNQNNEMQRNNRRTRLFSDDTPMSPDTHDNQKEVRLPSDNIPVSPESLHNQNKEKQSNKRRARLFSNDSSMSPDTMQNSQDPLHNNPKKDTTPVSPRPVQDQNNTLQGNRRRTRLFSNDSSMSPDTKQNNQDTSQDNPKKDNTPVSPRPVQDQNNTLRGKQRRTRLFSNDSSPEPKLNCQNGLPDSQKKVRLSSDTLPISPEPKQKHEVLQDKQGLLSISIPMSPDSIQNKRKTRLSSATSPISTASIQKPSNIVPVNQRKTRLSSFTSPTSPRPTNSEDLINNQRRTRLSSNSVPLSPPIESRKDDLQNNQRKARLSSVASPNSPAPIQTLNHAVSEESITDDEPIINLGNAYRSQDSIEMNELSMKDSTVKKAKTKKITKLDKLRKNLAPKYKIRRETSPVKSLIKPKHLTPIKKQVSANVTSASLNDKDVYEKAVKIMAELNSQKLSKAMKSPTRCTKEPMSPKPKNNMDIEIDSCNENKTSQNSLVTNRNKRKLSEVTDQCSVVLTKDPLLFMACEAKRLRQKQKMTTKHPTIQLQGKDADSPQNSVVKCKRVLRSSAVQVRSSTEDNVEISNTNDERTKETSTDPTAEKIKTTPTTCEPKPLVADTQKDENMKKSDDHHQLNTYDDLDLFAEDKQVETPSVSVKEIDSNPSTACQPKDSILCCMLEKYGTASVKPFAKKIPDSKVKLICEKIEQEVATISELPLNDTKNAMNTFVADLRKLNYKVFISGLIKYLTKPERKLELFAKQSSPAAPAMTKAEQILLYVITHLKTHWPTVDIVDAVLSSIEYALFKLNRTPEFEVIESTSHFYALLCRYFGAKSRLRLFILDAMYCIQFKSVPLIKQCLEVWMHIIPLAHMGIAKNPLVTCLVYLLHFYKCDDKFNRVQEIRNILSRRYFYQITDWNETKILEMFKNSIKDLKDIPIENKMLRLALIILAKRHGPRWCQNNIIKNLLQPMIEKENVPNSVKVFCVSMIGPLMKPYPVDMKVHCEIAINQLIDILNNNPSPQMEEAAIISMMFINRHDQYSTNQILLTRKMKPMSAELEKTLRDYVKRKPLQVWKKTLSKIAR
nr:LOW QUALITY PROTEIN: uncharacterized protein LOC110371892 [Helicoverpa armigera]